MEIVTPVENPVALEKLLKKHRYEVYALEGNLVFQSKHTKPSSWFGYLVIFIGILRMANQRMIQGLIGIVVGIALLIISHFERKKFDLTCPDIQKVAVSGDGIALTFRESNRQRVQLSREEIISMDLDISYDGNYTLGYVTMRDVRDVVYTPFILRNKSEISVKLVGEEIMKAIKNKLNID